MIEPPNCVQPDKSYLTRIYNFAIGNFNKKAAPNTDQLFIFSFSMINNSDSGLPLSAFTGVNFLMEYIHCIKGQLSKINFAYKFFICAIWQIWQNLLIVKNPNQHTNFSPTETTRYKLWYHLVFTSSTSQSEPAFTQWHTILNVDVLESAE